MGHSTEDDGVLFPLGKLAIHQTSRAVKYVPSTHKHCNPYINYKFGYVTRVHLPAKNDCAGRKGYEDHEEDRNCEVLVIRA